MKIAVIGSGITGLALSYFLKDRFTVHIFEKSRTPGGRISTYIHKHMFIDNGTHLITSTCRMTVNLLKELETLKYVEFIPPAAYIYEDEIYRRTFSIFDYSFMRLFIKNVFNADKVPLFSLIKFICYAIRPDIKIGFFKMPLVKVFTQPLIQKSNARIFTSFEVNKNNLGDILNIYDIVVFAVSPYDLSSIFDVRCKMNNINFIICVYDAPLEEKIFIVKNRSFDFIFIRNFFGYGYVEFVKGCGRIDENDVYRFLNIYGLKDPIFIFRKNVLNATYEMGVRIERIHNKKIFYTGGFDTFLPDTIEAAILSAYKLYKKIKYL